MPIKTEKSKHIHCGLLNPVFSILYNPVTLHVVSRQGALASSGSLSEMQNPGPHPDLMNQICIWTRSPGLANSSVETGAQNTAHRVECFQ